MLACVIAAAGCSRTTGKLSPETAQRLAAEDILRQADDIGFRFTHGIGTRSGGWEDVLASIVVTRRTILIHRNEETLAELSAASPGEIRVHRDHDRLSVRIGGPRSAKSWSFRPPDDPEGWARDLRAVLTSESTAR